MLRLLVINRLLEPGSEFGVHRHRFVESAMDTLLEADFAVADKDRPYRCLEKVLEHKQELFVWLKQKWTECKRGYGRDSRPDCLQMSLRW